MSTARRYNNLAHTTLALPTGMLILCIEQGREGMIIVKTKQALLLAHYPETVQPGSASLTVEKLGDYLIGVGY